MKIACVTLLLLSITIPALAQQVTFTCVITGSGADGFDIQATNPGPGRKKCSATCTVTRSDGSTHSWSYSGTVNAGPPAQRHWFGGEAGVKGAPLRNPMISKASCE
jgi:hypothetical protein